MRSSCDQSRLDTEAFLEKFARLLLRSSSAWAYSLIVQPGRFSSGKTGREVIITRRVSSDSLVSTRFSIL